jgi:hypothetical protein
MGRPKVPLISMGGESSKSVRPVTDRSTLPRPPELAVITGYHDKTAAENTRFIGEGCDYTLTPNIHGGGRG